MTAQVEYKKDLVKELVVELKDVPRAYRVSCQKNIGVTVQKFNNFFCESTSLESDTLYKWNECEPLSDGYYIKIKGSKQIANPNIILASILLIFSSFML